MRLTNLNLYNFIFTALVLVLVILGQVHVSHPDDQLLAGDSSQTALMENNSFKFDVNYRVPSAAVFQSQAAIVLAKVLNSDTEILSRNAVQRWPIASITKLMTAVIALENLNGEQPVTITEEVVAEEGISGNFIAGEIFTVNDLIKAMLVVSSNDAAAALATTYGREQFLELMRRKAAALDMSQTTFADVTGLSPLNQSTAQDLVKLISYIYNHQPEIFVITHQPQVAIMELRSKIKRTLTNINNFAGRPNFLGGKTGFIDEAGGNLVSLWLPTGWFQPLLIIVMGADDRFGETQKIYDYIISGSR